jgi:hypothetical protein
LIWRGIFSKWGSGEVITCILCTFSHAYM